jgi:7,8-dihydroneopterin aldolase/epimerase/oxygenase
VEARRSQAVEIQVDALDVWGRHGALPEEKTRAQRLRIDLRLSVPDCRGAVSDRLVDTVDYSAVIELVAEIVEGRSYELLERLAQALAEAVIARFPGVDTVWVRVAKPEPPISRPLGAVSIVLELSRAVTG